MSYKKFFALFLIVSVVLACNLPTNMPQPATDSGSAPIAQQNDTNQDSNPPSADQPAQPAPEQGAQPKPPTPEPPTPDTSEDESGDPPQNNEQQPAENQNNSNDDTSSGDDTQKEPAAPAPQNDSTPPTISEVSTSGTPVYYFEANCGPTTLTLSAKVSDDSGSIAQVWVNYQFVSYSAGVGGSQWFQSNLTSQGQGRYETTINIATQAEAELQAHEGTMEYQIFASDAAGNTLSEPSGFVYGVEVQPCFPMAPPPELPADAITISNVNLYPQDTVYYGSCSGGEITVLNVQAAIDPLDQISAATVYYSYSSSSGVFGPYAASMWQLGIGDYAGDVDTSQLAQATMNGADGSIDFYIQVVDLNGQTTDSSLMSVNLLSCGGNNPPPAATEPDIRYFLGPASVNAGETLTLEWEVWDACKVFLDGQEVNHNDTYSYVVPATEGNTTYTHNLEAWGSTCDATTQKTSQAQVEIKATGGGNGGGTVTFVNNTSHELVSLEIDGTEHIFSEADSILPGNSVDFSVTAGSHNYVVYNGWWDNGMRNTMYWYSGSFNDQSGTLNFYDPSIQELLTNFGSNRYFETGYMGDDMNWHTVGLCFYADGSFTYFDNSVQLDSGSYSEISRSNFMVTVRLSGATESMDGLYYESYALFDLPNGPGGTTIEYAPQGACP